MKGGVGGAKGRGKRMGEEKGGCDIGREKPRLLMRTRIRAHERGQTKTMNIMQKKIKRKKKTEKKQKKPGGLSSPIYSEPIYI